METNNSLIELHEGRKHIYYFLSRFFIDIPDESMYEQNIINDTCFFYY